jgi:hypothetical protein
VPSEGKHRRFRRKNGSRLTRGRAVGITSSKIRFLTSTIQYKSVTFFTSYNIFPSTVVVKALCYKPEGRGFNSR